MELFNVVLFFSYCAFVFLPKQQRLMQEAFAFSNMPNVWELQKKMVLALVNTHFSFETVEPLPSNVIPVGGLQIQEPKPLDAVISKFIDSSKKGSILFSLGSNVKSELMSPEKKKAFIDAFKKFSDYNFIWKYESDLDLELPKNVMIQPWLRQNDILAHPKMRAFISHCGLLSSQEAAWYGVPVIGIPFFTDQQRVNFFVSVDLAGLVLKRFFFFVC